MLKKSLIILSIFFTVIFISNFTFASSVLANMQNVMDSAGNTLQNAGNGISNMMNDVGSGINNMVNDMENGMNEDDSGYGMTNGTMNDDYTANRTSSETDMTNANNTLVWVILAVATVAIIALVWYYMSQPTDRYNNDDDNH